MQIKKRIMTFFSAFTEPKENLDYNEKKGEPQSFFFSEIIDCKKRSYFNAKRAAYQNTYVESTC